MFHSFQHPERELEIVVNAAHIFLVAERVPGQVDLLLNVGPGNALIIVKGDVDEVATKLSSDIRTVPVTTVSIEGQLVQGFMNTMHIPSFATLAEDSMAMQMYVKEIMQKYNLPAVTEVSTPRGSVMVVGTSQEFLAKLKGH